WEKNLFNGVGPMSDVTVVLDAIQSGDPEAPAQLLPRPRALVHEAYLRLVGGGRGQHWDSRGHSFTAAAEARRRILVDNPHRKCALKHGGAFVRRVLDEAALLAPEPREDLLALDEALTSARRRGP